MFTARPSSTKTGLQAVTPKRRVVPGLNWRRLSMAAALVSALISGLVLWVCRKDLLAPGGIGDQDLLVGVVSALNSPGVQHTFTCGNPREPFNHRLGSLCPHHQADCFNAQGVRRGTRKAACRTSGGNFSVHAFESWRMGHQGKRSFRVSLWVLLEHKISAVQDADVNRLQRNWVFGQKCLQVNSLRWT